MADISKITIPSGTYSLKDAWAREAIAEIQSRGIKFTIGWKGDSIPDVTKIPAGVVVIYQGTEYTGTLAPATEVDGELIPVPDIILIYSSNGAGKNIYDEYASVNDGTAATPNYIWEKIGTTDIQIDDLGDLAYSDTATGSVTVNDYVTAASFSGGTVTSTSESYTPQGTISVPTIDVSLDTKSVSVKDANGSVTAGQAASFTRGSFNGGSFTPGTDVFVAPVLTTTVDTATETLTISFTAGSFTQGQDVFTPATHGADTFTPNTPTAVTLPTFKAEEVVTGLQSATATAPTFTGTAATITSTGTATGTVTLTKDNKTITTTVTPD